MARVFSFALIIIIVLALLLISAAIVIPVCIVSAKNKKKAAAPMPIYTAPATVISKRFDTNAFFIGFMLENGYRFELCVPEGVFATVAEGENGMLTYQGNYCVSFQKN